MTILTNISRNPKLGFLGTIGTNAAKPESVSNLGYHLNNIFDLFKIIKIIKINNIFFKIL